MVNVLDQYHIGNMNPCIFKSIVSTFFDIKNCKVWYRWKEQIQLFHMDRSRKKLPPKKKFFGLRVVAPLNSKPWTNLHVLFPMWNIRSLDRKAFFGPKGLTWTFGELLGLRFFGMSVMKNHTFFLKNLKNLKMLWNEYCNCYGNNIFSVTFLRKDPCHIDQ